MVEIVKLGKNAIQQLLSVAPKKCLYKNTDRNLKIWLLQYPNELYVVMDNNGVLTMDAYKTSIENVVSHVAGILAHNKNEYTVYKQEMLNKLEEK